MPRSSPIRNRLLAALPRAQYKRLSNHLEPVKLAFGQVLYEPGGRIRHVYFPNEGVVSLLTVVGSNKAAEVGIVGNEGMVGSSAALGVPVSHLRAVVQGAGSAMQLSTAHLREEFSKPGALRPELFRFTHALLSQFAQTAACNRFHKVEARMARWLLVSRDRLGSETLFLTHGFLSQMLGVRRVGVTIAASALQRRGIITYRRGNIQIVNSKALEAAACECYRVVKAIYDRNFPIKAI